MKYICLIYGNEGIDEAEAAAMWQEYGAYQEAVVGAGKFVAGDPLEASSTATLVRVREGSTLTTDGPYAETKEQIGGYYILDCDDLDDAIEWASKIPSAKSGAIEVRPLMKM